MQNENYLVIDGKRVELSDETVGNLKRELLLKDKSVDVTHYADALISVRPPRLLDIRINGEYRHKGFYINSTYEWEIKEDSVGVWVLIPTKK